MLIWPLFFSNELSRFDATASAFSGHRVVLVTKVTQASGGRQNVKNLSEQIKKRKTQKLGGE